MLAILHIAEPPGSALLRSPKAPTSMLDVLLGSPSGRTRTERLLDCMKTQYVAAYS